MKWKPIWKLAWLRELPALFPIAFERDRRILIVDNDYLPWQGCVITRSDDSKIKCGSCEVTKGYVVWTFC